MGRRLAWPESQAERTACVKALRWQKGYYVQRSERSPMGMESRKKRGVRLEAGAEEEIRALYSIPRWLDFVQRAVGCS